MCTKDTIKLDYKFSFFPYLIEIGVFVIFRHIYAKTTFNCHLWPCIIQFQIWSLLMQYFLWVILKQTVQDHIRAHITQSSCGVTVVDVAIDVSKLLNKKKPTLYYQLPLCVEFI